jgi:hypothetical protein
MYKFTYLGQHYEVADEFADPSKPRRMLSAALNLNYQTKREYYFTIYHTEEGFYTCYSKLKSYWKRYATHKHLQKGKFSKQECDYLTNLTRDAQDFRQAIALVNETLKTMYEIA